jgi:hypothetical protein
MIFISPFERIGDLYGSKASIETGYGHFLSLSYSIEAAHENAILTLTTFIVGR